MENKTQVFLQKVIEKYKSGHAREHAYRPALQEFFEGVTGLNVINDPKRSEFGAPDFVFLKGKTVIAYCEAKDITVSLDDIEKKEQMERYYGYSNLILTNGLDFRFFRNTERYGEPIIIGKIQNGAIETNDSQFHYLEDTIQSFITESKEPIKSGSILAKVMAGHARRIRDNIKIFLADENDAKNENLLSVYNAMKTMLIADLDKARFADMYAQTLVYGLFVARYHDESQENFSRQEARDLVPASNPFLREFFDHITGATFDKRIEFIVDELCGEFTNADVKAIVHNFYKTDTDQSRDPIIHFYEDFLQAYDATERKKLGVFYTPLPVVNFIVRSVDEILKKEFGLSQGLADSSKIEMLKEEQGKRHKVQVHKVQVLDPATGTGTFLNEAILHIRKSFEGQEGRWSQYVNDDLLPRLHGFELMMASYTIAHLKISSTLQKTGVKEFSRRLGVYLTNALEKGGEEQPNLFGLGFGKAITNETNQANKVKNELPIMVVMGNPPYSVSSQNKGEWIQEMIKDYKKDLGERKINLDDDYIKFIRFAEYFIEKNEAGIVAMITNNSFIDGITHRQMRKHLLETFDIVYVFDLHGNSKKKEKSPDGSKDENVFNIMQGVSISLFVRKNEKKKGLGEVYHAEVYGTREHKFEVLNAGGFEKTEWKKLEYSEPYYFFVPKDFGENVEYDKGFKIDELFQVSNSGVKTDRDTLFIDMEKNVLEKRIQKLLSVDCDGRFKYEFRVIDSGSYKLTEKLKGKSFDDNYLQPIQYRPFDYQWIYYDPSLVSRPASKVMSHIVGKENIAIVTSRQFGGGSHFICLLTKTISEISSQPFAPYTLFPLYLYTEQNEKISNLNKEIWHKINEIVGETTPENILDYIYAVLHSPTYREKYKEFLKIDFPRVPFPKNKEEFWRLVPFGAKLRELHLMSAPECRNFITTFQEAGNDTVEKIKYEDGKVFINEKQFFGNVPAVAWNFYIGGYQPAQKWLKDRKGRVLTNADIEHYQKIIVVLMETEKIMKEIEKTK